MPTHMTRRPLVRPGDHDGPAHENLTPAGSIADSITPGALPRACGHRNCSGASLSGAWLQNAVYEIGSGQARAHFKPPGFGGSSHGPPLRLTHVSPEGHGVAEQSTVNPTSDLAQNGAPVLAVTRQTQATAPPA